MKLATTITRMDCAAASQTLDCSNEYTDAQFEHDVKGARATLGRMARKARRAIRNGKAIKFPCA